MEEKIRILDELESRVGGRFQLTALLQKRIRELVAGAPRLVDVRSDNPIDVAIEEIRAGKVALVTGANTGLGQGIAVALAQAGADIVGISRSNSSDTERGVVAAGRRFHSVHADLERSQESARIVAQAIEAAGRVDILVNNAGIIRRNDALKFTEQDWDSALNVNLKTPFFLAQAAARIRQDAEESMERFLADSGLPRARAHAARPGGGGGRDRAGGERRRRAHRHGDARADGLPAAGARQRHAPGPPRRAVSRPHGRAEGRVTPAARPDGGTEER